MNLKSSILNIACLMVILFSQSLAFSYQSVAKNLIFLSHKNACSGLGNFRHYTNFWPGMLRAREQSKNAHALWRSSLSSPRRQKSQGSASKISPQQLRPVPLTESTPRYIGIFSRHFFLGLPKLYPRFGNLFAYAQTSFYSR